MVETDARRTRSLDRARGREWDRAETEPGSDVRLAWLALENLTSEHGHQRTRHHLSYACVRSAQREVDVSHSYIYFNLTICFKRGAARFFYLFPCKNTAVGIEKALTFCVLYHLFCVMDYLSLSTICSTSSHPLFVFVEQQMCEKASELCFSLVFGDDPRQTQSAMWTCVSSVVICGIRLEPCLHPSIVHSCIPLYPDTIILNNFHRWDVFLAATFTSFIVTGAQWAKCECNNSVS